jgi:hypothetical protein
LQVAEQHAAAKLTKDSRLAQAHSDLARELGHEQDYDECERDPTDRINVARGLARVCQAWPTNDGGEPCGPPHA